jgi:DNA transformation protein
MPDTSPLIEHLLDQLSDWGAVAARPRPEGWVLYRDGLVFALLAQDTLYLKVDDANRERFEAAGGIPLGDAGGGGAAASWTYWTPPKSALDDAEELALWAQSGFEAAQRVAGLGTTGETRRPRRRPRRPV